MKISITEEVSTVKIIDVDLPYFYKHDLMTQYGDSVIYGRIEETLHTSIQETLNFDGSVTYEIEKEDHDSIKNTGLASYFKSQYSSNQNEFEQVKERCLIFLNGF